MGVYLYDRVEEVKKILAIIITIKLLDALSYYNALVINKGSSFVYIGMLDHLENLLCLQMVFRDDIFKPPALIASIKEHSHTTNKKLAPPSCASYLHLLAILVPYSDWHIELAHNNILP